MAYGPALDERALDAAAEHRRQAWGSERLREAIARSEGASSCAGWLEGGELCASLERHRIRLATPAGAIDAVGISQVVTATRFRGRGHASALLASVLDDAFGRGARAALLFSEIGNHFYARHGFAAASHLTWSARVAALPETGVSLRTTDDVAALAAIYAASWRDHPEFVRMLRSEASWRLSAWRNRSGTAHLVEGEAYIVAREDSTDDGTRVLWIDDAAGALPKETLWAAMRELARAARAERVLGWLRPDQAGGPFVAAARKHCIPMLAFRDAIEAAAAPRSHFALLDQL